MFYQVLKDPILFTWATEQINKDWEEKQALIKTIYEALLPWLNPEMYSIVEKKKAEKSQKAATIAGVDNENKIEQTNAFNTFLKNMGITKEDLDG